MIVTLQIPAFVGGRYWPRGTHHDWPDTTPPPDGTVIHESPATVPVEPEPEAEPTTLKELQKKNALI